MASPNAVAHWHLCDAGASVDCPSQRTHSAYRSATMPRLVVLGEDEKPREARPGPDGLVDYVLSVLG